MAIPWLILLGCVTGLLVSCTPPPSPTPFRPPTFSFTPTPPPSTPTPALPAPTVSLTPTDLPTATPTLTCINDLTWLQDLTYPDNTPVAPGQVIDKQWLVQNSGTCDWGPAYRLRNVNGLLLGAEDDLPLYPARAGSQAILRIQFWAPLDAGLYRSTWRATAPDGTPFGQDIYLLILVSP